MLLVGCLLDDIMFAKNATMSTYSRPYMLSDRCTTFIGHPDGVCAPAMRDRSQFAPGVFVMQ